MTSIDQPGSSLGSCPGFPSFKSPHQADLRVIDLVSSPVWWGAATNITYLQQFGTDTSCNQEELPKAMDDRDEWQERVREIRTNGMIWYIYIHIYNWQKISTGRHLAISVDHTRNHMRKSYEKPYEKISTGRHLAISVGHTRNHMRNQPLQIAITSQRERIIRILFQWILTRLEK